MIRLLLSVLLFVQLTSIITDAQTKDYFKIGNSLNVALTKTLVLISWKQVKTQYPSLNLLTLKL